MTTDADPRPAALRPALHLAAAVLLGQAVVAGAHGFSPVGLSLIAAAIVLATGGLFVPADAGRRWAAAATRAVVAVGSALAIWRLPLVDLYLKLPAARPTVGPFVLLAAVAAAGLAVLAAGRPRGAVWACVPVLLVTFVLMGAFYVGLAPRPVGDVFLVNDVGADTLLAGHDPYAITFPDVYGPGSGFYPPGLVVNGRVRCGYPYPPLGLVLSAGAKAAAGDVRYADLAAWAGAAAVVAYGVGRRRAAAAGPAMLVLFAPGVFHLLENANTEPVVVLMVAATAAAAVRRWAWATAVLAGLTLSAKQYLPLAAPAVLMVAPRPWRSAGRWAAAVIGAGVAVTGPFIAWGPRPFVHSLSAMNVGMVRADSLGFLPVVLRWTGWHPPLLLCPAAAAAVAGGLVLWRAPRTAGGFAAGLAVVCLWAFAASPLAFGNYYVLAAAALCVAAAAEG